MRRRYLAKKLAEFAVYALAGLLVAWEAWPGILSPPVLTPDYLIFVGGLFLLVVLLVFLIVLAWNERLARIDGGRLTWPFPFQRANGVRTRYVALEEIADAKLTAGPASRRGLDLTLRDGTRLFLPETVFGVDYSELLQILVRYVRERSVPDPGGSPDRG